MKSLDDRCSALGHELHALRKERDQNRALLQTLKIQMDEKDLERQRIKLRFYGQSMRKIGDLTAILDESIFASSFSFVQLERQVLEARL